MRHGEYRDLFVRDGEVLVNDLEILTLWAPDMNNPDEGPDEHMSAVDAVEYHRALSAWLQLHRTRYPIWHRDYVKNNPGGDNQ